MKLKIKEFEILARRKRYLGGESLFRELGGGKNAYSGIKKGYAIGYEMVKEIYNAFGEEETKKIIDWEDETVEGLKGKYIQVGQGIY